MINRSTKLRLRRKFRRSRHQVEDLGVQAEEQMERHFFGRLSRLVGVRRFVAGWILLAVLIISGVVVQTLSLASYYKSVQPVAGGTFNEGLLGSFTNANPLYATGPVDVAVSKLVFASLLKYDEQNKLVGDLAETWQIDQTEQVYTVTLRPDLQWQDGKPLTAEDVVFTYKTIQNPDTRSPLLTSWQNIKVEAKDNLTVVFTLPNVLSSFAYSLTNGIVPKHLLGEIPAQQLRATTFNTGQPIGAGPFSWDTVELAQSGEAKGKIGLTANELYYAGTPALQRYVLHYYSSEDELTEAFKSREVAAVSGLDSLPDTLSSDTAIQQFSVPLTAQVMVFFKTSQEILADVKVRQALVHGVNHSGLIEQIGYPVIASRSPFLKGQPGFDPAISQLSYDQQKANTLLDDAGWTKGTNGIREKAGKKLGFTLYSQSTSEYAYVTQKLQQDWAKIGVEVEVLLQPDNDLKSTVAFHNYDALLYGISLGPDSDVYAYWGSTQADERAANRVNFSEYKSKVADQALEAGRTRTDTSLRAVKYKPFLEAWRNDAPALALYQPRYLYITRDAIYGFNPVVFNAASDRYANVNNWMIRQEKVRKIQ